MKNLSLRAQAVLFVVVTFAVSWIEVYFIAKSAGGVENNVRVFGLMWTPGLVGLLMSWVFGWKFKDIGFKLGPGRYYAISYAVPAVTALLILLTLILTGLGQFEISPKLFETLGQNFLVGKFLIGLLIGTASGFVSGLGEELGWRGFLHSKLTELRWPHPFLITGIIWAVWHWPLILFSNYATSDQPALSVALFTVMIVSLSVFMGLIRAKSGSVFTAGLIHGVHNLWIQAIYPLFLKKGPLDPYFGGESGVVIAIFYSLIAVFIYKKYLVRGRPV